MTRAATNDEPGRACRSKPSRRPSPPPADPIPEGLWLRCPSVRPDDLPATDGIEPARLPRVRAPLPDLSAAERVRAARRPGYVHCRCSPGCEPRDPLNVHRSEELPGPHPGVSRYKTGAKRGLPGGRDASSRVAPTMVACLDLTFMMGSMGSGGRRDADAVDRARDRRRSCPSIIVVLLGRRPHAGSRAEPDADGQDLRRPGAARRRGRLFISVLTDPTTGGVTASFAMLG